MFSCRVASDGIMLDSNAVCRVERNVPVTVMTDSNDRQDNSTAPRLSRKDEISREEKRLAELESEVEQARASLKRLRTESESDPTYEIAEEQGIPEPAVREEHIPATPDEKIALFRSLFRGREDVYPQLWTNPRKGKKGYAPACANEWGKGICEKPRVRCGECPNQAFIPLDGHAIRKHLSGEHVIGVYPLLPDETCWFLAVDFDKDGWEADVGAFTETCREVGIPVSVERSRSGNGAHVWLFFSEHVAADIARKMGSYLLTRTMEARHELSMSSYDRLFPNQDTMPKGGFGNLIALPLQKSPRRRGNTVFLDEQLNPYTDQWAYLASVDRLAPDTVTRLVGEASGRSQILGVRPVVMPVDPGTEQALPWEQDRRASAVERLQKESLPENIKGMLANRLFIQKQGLPSILLNAIKRVAAFQNPEFYKRQRMRLSTALTPRIISCAEDLPEHIALPRGCVPDVSALLEELGIDFVIDDHRRVGEVFETDFQGQLRPLQEEAIEAMASHDIGVLVAPPGAGKTVMGIHMIARRGRNTLILVHRQPLLDQWKNQIALFLDIRPQEIGQIGGGRRKLNGQLDVGMVQSLVRKGKVDERIGQYGHIIVDECHHVPALSIERVLAESHARYFTGFTATPYRRDGLHPILHMQVGPTRYVMDPRDAYEDSMEHRLIVRDTHFTVTPGGEDLSIQELYRAIGNDEARNTMILDDVIRAVNEGRSPLVLTERRDHLAFLTSRLRGFVRHLVVLQGGMSAKKRQELIDRIADIPPDEERLILATGRYIGEGFDDARLDTLFLAMPISWKGVLVQYTGRLHRSYSGKEDVIIFDYADRQIPKLNRMFEKRLRAYRSIGYESVSSPPWLYME